MKTRFVPILLSMVFLLSNAYAQKKEKNSKTTSEASKSVSTSSETAASASNPLSKEKYESVAETYFTFLDDALKNPDAVYKLRLTKQNLTAVPAGISKFKNLVSLDLSDNQITEVPAELFSLTNLIELDLGNNQLTSVPSRLCSLKNLESLSLNGNKITSVGPDLFCLVNLKKLFLQNNEIASLSSDIGNLKNLRYLYLFGNLLTKIPEEITSLSQLQVLLLNYNRLKEPLHGLEKLKYLRYYSEDGQLLDSRVFNDVVIDKPNRASEENLEKTTERKAILESYDRAEYYIPGARINKNNTQTNKSQSYSSQNAPKKKNHTARTVLLAIFFWPALFFVNYN